MTRAYATFTPVASFASVASFMVSVASVPDAFASEVHTS